MLCIVWSSFTCVEPVDYKNIEGCRAVITKEIFDVWSQTFSTVYVLNQHPVWPYKPWTVLSQITYTFELLYKALCVVRPVLFAVNAGLVFKKCKCSSRSCYPILLELSHTVGTQTVVHWLCCLDFRCQRASTCVSASEKQHLRLSSWQLSKSSNKPIYIISL